MRTLQVSLYKSRRVRTLAVAILAGALFLVPGAKPPVTQALSKIVTEQNISRTDDVQSEAPQISVGSDFLGVSWGERVEKANGKVALTTTPIGTTFPNPNSFDASGTQIAYQWPDIAVDAGGTSHIAYIQGNNIYYRNKPKNGSVSSSRFVASSDFPNPTRIAVGSDGVIWIVWRNSSGSSIFYRRSTDGGSKWINGSDGGRVASESGNMKALDVAVGPDNIAHVVWSNVSRGDIKVADWNGSSFTTSDITSDGNGTGTFDEDPTITVDPQNVQHVLYRKRLDASGDSWGITYAHRLAGSKPDLYTTIAITNGNAGYSPSIGSDEKSNVYVVYSNPVRSGVRQVVFWGKTPNGQWDGPLPLPLGNWDSRNSVTGRNGEAHIAYQQELSSDKGEIRYVRVDFNSVPPMSATPVLADGNGTTNQNPVKVSFTDVNGGPTELRWRWGAAPTDADNDSNGWQAFTNPKNISLPANVDRSLCQNLVLYTQVRNSTVTQQGTSQDAVNFDGAVQANIRVTNPFLAGLPTTFSQSVKDTYNSTSDGAYNGDPDYTRMPQYFLGIYNNNDCSGLSTFNVPASSASGSIANGTYENKLTLAQGSIPNAGNKITINVAVTDKLGNLVITPKELIYDPANTAQTGTPNTEGLPVLNDGSATVDGANSIIRTLTFQNVDVDDTTYGKFENLPAGSQFWGVWIANSTSPVTNPNASSLQWFPVEVANPGPGFTVSWNLFNGIAPANRQPGTYYIYIKFLDGAGNATVGTLPVVQATLQDGFSVPTLYMPTISK